MDQTTGRFLKYSFFRVIIASYLEISLTYLDDEEFRKTNSDGFFVVSSQFPGRISTRTAYLGL